MAMAGQAGKAMESRKWCRQVSSAGGDRGNAAEKKTHKEWKQTNKASPRTKLWYQTIETTVNKKGKKNFCTRNGKTSCIHYSILTPSQPATSPQCYFTDVHWVLLGGRQWPLGKVVTSLSAAGPGQNLAWVGIHWCTWCSSTSFVFLIAVHILKWWRERSKHHNTPDILGDSEMTHWGLEGKDCLENVHDKTLVWIMTKCIPF